MQLHITALVLQCTSRVVEIVECSVLCYVGLVTSVQYKHCFYIWAAY